MDDIAGAKLRAPVMIPADWTFDDYRNQSPWRRFMFDFLGPLEDRTILDLGCGVHPTPIYFALAGAKQVYACDVSSKAVAYVRTLAEQHGVADQVKVIECAAEQLPFDDEHFDLAHGEAVLHHLRLPLAGPEIARVMKEGGKGGFKDPLGQNPVFEWARDYLLYKGKDPAKGTDAPLRFRDIETFGQSFAEYSYRGFGLTAAPTAFLRRRRNSEVVRMAHRVDGLVLRVLPFLQRFCQYVVTSVEK